MTLKEKANKALEYKKRWEEFKSLERYEDALEYEKKYLKLRLEVIREIDKEEKESKSVDFTKIIEQIENEPPAIKIETGIDVLDKNLVEYYDGHNIGGLGVGNFILIGGVKGAGKTTISLKILSKLTNANNVAWFNFEMTKKQGWRIVKKFKDIANWKNLKYYDGDRDLDAITNEIKLLSATGVKHILIDSLMKIKAEGTNEVAKYEKISSRLSELAKRLEINIYLIAQVSQETERYGGSAIKYGNAIEYEADYIFFIYKKPKKENRKILKDDFGDIIFEEDVRVLKCMKNRVDERLFTIEIDKKDIFDIEVEVHTYGPKVSMPMV